jgi:hypothetical protein
MNENEKFEIFKIYNLPAITQKFDQNTGTSMVAQYDLESEVVAIIIGKNELLKCSQPIMGFCFVKSPIYETNLSKLCVIALFLQNEENIRKYCKIIVKLKTILPLANYISSGKWIISTRSRINLAVYCENGSRETQSLTIVPPVHVIQLQMSCSANSDYLTLPSYFQSENNYEIALPTDKFLQSYNMMS